MAARRTTAKQTTISTEEITLENMDAEKAARVIAEVEAAAMADAESPYTPEIVAHAESLLSGDKTESTPENQTEEKDPAMTALTEDTNETGEMVNHAMDGGFVPDGEKGDEKTDGNEGGETPETSSGFKVPYTDPTKLVLDDELSTLSGQKVLKAIAGYRQIHERISASKRGDKKADIIDAAKGSSDDEIKAIYTEYAAIEKALSEKYEAMRVLVESKSGKVEMTPEMETQYKTKAAKLLGLAKKYVDIMTESTELNPGDEPLTEGFLKALEMPAARKSSGAKGKTPGESRTYTAKTDAKPQLNGGNIHITGTDNAGNAVDVTFNRFSDVQRGNKALGLKSQPAIRPLHELWAKTVAEKVEGDNEGVITAWNKWPSHTAEFQWVPEFGGPNYTVTITFNAPNK